MEPSDSGGTADSGCKLLARLQPLMRLRCSRYSSFPAAQKNRPQCVNGATLKVFVLIGILMLVIFMKTSDGDVASPARPHFRPDAATFHGVVHFGHSEFMFFVQESNNGVALVGEGTGKRRRRPNASAGTSQQLSISLFSSIVVLLGQLYHLTPFLVKAFAFWRVSSCESDALTTPADPVAPADPVDHYESKEDLLPLCKEPEPDTEFCNQPTAVLPEPIPLEALVHGDDDDDDDDDDDGYADVSYYTSFYESVEEEVSKKPVTVVRLPRSPPALVVHVSPSMGPHSWYRRFQEGGDQTLVKASFSESASNLMVDVIRSQFQSVTCNVGGYAGGDKVVRNGIFVKGLRNGMLDDCVLAKTSAHERKGAMASSLCAAGGRDLVSPFVVTTDLFGYTLVATPQLPLNASTRVHAADLTEICQHLNLRTGHPKDLEVHLMDGRRYLVDCARLCPPEALPKRSKQYFQGSDFMCRLLRPEFLMEYQGGLLCSDTHSTFLKGDQQIEMHRLKMATSYLKRNNIPKFADSLSHLLECGILHPGQLSDLAHRHGVNVRHLGWVYNNVLVAKNVRLRMMLLVEMASRVVKRKLRAAQRHAVETSDHHVVAAHVCQATLSFLNGNLMGPHWIPFWRDVIFPDVLSYFRLQTVHPKDCERILSEVVYLNQIISRLFAMCVIKASIVSSTEVHSLALGYRVKTSDGHVITRMLE